MKCLSSRIQILYDFSGPHAHFAKLPKAYLLTISNLFYFAGWRPGTCSSWGSLFSWYLLYFFAKHQILLRIHRVLCTRPGLLTGLFLREESSFLFCSQFHWCQFLLGQPIHLILLFILKTPFSSWFFWVLCTLPGPITCHSTVGSRRSECKAPVIVGLFDDISILVKIPTRGNYFIKRPSLTLAFQFLMKYFHSKRCTKTFYPHCIWKE